MVDDEDYERCNQYNWSLGGSSNKDFAPQTTTNYRVTKISNMVMQNFTNMFDHKNQDSFDNKKENLRITTYSQNNANRKKYKGNYSSKYKGVSYKKDSDIYTTCIMVNKKAIHLGSYLFEVDAAKAYNRAARKYFGEFASLNKIEKD